MRTGSAIMSAAHLLIAMLIFQYEGSWESHPFAAIVAVACVYVFTAAFGMSFGPVAWVLPSEVFPLSMRGKGAAISTASNWLNNCGSLIFISSSLRINILDVQSLSACSRPFLWRYRPQLRLVYLAQRRLLHIYGRRLPSPRRQGFHSRPSTGRLHRQLGRGMLSFGSRYVFCSFEVQYDDPCHTD